MSTSSGPVGHPGPTRGLVLQVGGSVVLTLLSVAFLLVAAAMAAGTAALLWVRWRMGRRRRRRREGRSRST